KVGAAIGLFDDERAERLVEAGVDALVLDIAHCHHEKALEKIEKFSSLYPGTVLVAGNVATGEGARDLEAAGADIVKVGIGPGSACTTRKVAGAGVPQFTAVKECVEAVEVPVIADGGIREPGDLAKALMAGAAAGMIGGLLAGTDEAPGEVITEDGEKKKVYRGMASYEAAQKRAEREGREFSYEDRVAEGVDSTTTYRGSLGDMVHRLQGGLRSAISYCGADELSKARENSEFIKISNSTQSRNGAHMESL
ncbi:MAG: IMP dehydrogenase, partial [Candidatus Aenigmatarchaeota archaeon]